MADSEVQQIFMGHFLRWRTVTPSPSPVEGSGSLLGDAVFVSTSPATWWTRAYRAFYHGTSCLFTSPCCIVGPGPILLPTLAKDVLLLLSRSSAKWQRPRAESAMERHRPQGPHLNCKGDWARAGCVPASICIWLARSLLHAAHILNWSQSKQLASTTFFLNKSAPHPEHLRVIENRHRAIEIAIGLFELMVVLSPYKHFIINSLSG